VTLFALLLSSPLFADYPIVPELDSNDVLFRQIEQDIQRFNLSERTDTPMPALNLYRYRIRPGQDLLSIAARLTLPYSSIATLNRMDHREFPDGMKEILIPNIPGLFIADDPQNMTERLVAAHAASDSSAARAPAQHIRVRTASGETDFRFEPGADFTPDERLAFFQALFQFPVKGGIITSYYGMRTNPFSGLFTFHGGIDIEAPVGTDVTASRDGVVIDTGTDHEYGNYVELKHQDGYETFYGHLEVSLVRLNEKVSSGMIIGKVGNTGLSTGPHLHFEVRYHGKSQDPMKVLAVTQ
jgi:murein DD-endopeptidase MepM/ murein hydrolase activator NlpD